MSPLLTVWNRQVRQTTYPLWALLIVVLAFILGVTPRGAMAQDTAPAAAATPASADEPLVVRIGHVGPLTGPIAHLGRDNENGAILAIEELNQRGVMIGGRTVKLELVTADDGGSLPKAVQAAQFLIDKGVVGVIGHLNSGTSIPASEVYNRVGIPHISPSATNPRLTRTGYKTTFRIIMDDEDLGLALGNYAVRQLAGARIVVVDDQTAYGQGIADHFLRGAKASGGQVVTREFATDKTTDFSALVERIKPLAPDLVFYGGMDATAGRLIRELNAQEIYPTVMGGDGICSPELAGVAGYWAINRVKVVCAEAGGVIPAELARMKDFYRRFNNRFQIDVMVYAPFTYDAVRVMVDAMVKAGSSDPKVYLPVLAQTTGFQGVTGDISFDAKGDIKQGAYTLYQFLNGKRQQLDVRLGSQP